MHFATSLIAALVSLYSLQVVLAGHIDLSGRMVHKRSPLAGAEERRDLALPPRQELRKRFDARFTFYKTGLGACGGHNVDSDYVSKTRICSRPSANLRVTADCCNEPWCKRVIRFVLGKNGGD
jgi:hypothetical protein